MVTFQRLCRSCLARHFLLADGGPAVLRIVQEPRSHRSVALARNLISRLVSLRDVQDAIKTSGAITDVFERGPCLPCRGLHFDTHSGGGRSSCPARKAVAHRYASPCMW